MRRTLSLAAALALLAAFTIGGAALANADPDQCEVTNKASHDTFDNLQDAVNGAEAGDTLEVEGTCHGPTTIGKNLTIKGKGRQPTLAGYRDIGVDGSVLTIGTRDDRDVEVRIDRLTITNGYNGYGGVS